MSKRWHETLDPKRRGWILNDTWLEMLKSDSTIMLYVHGKGAYLERSVFDETGMRRTERVLDIDAEELIQWCEDEGITVQSSPVREFESVKGILIKTEDQAFSFRMRWPPFS